MNLIIQNAVILMLALALDRLLSEPPHAIHPVVWMGRVTRLLERIAPRRPVPTLLFGGVILLAVAGGSAVATWLVISVLQTLGEIAYVVGGALILRTTFTVRGLSEAAGKTQQYLAKGKSEQARATLESLVGRDPTSLTPDLMASAAIESVAENTTDSFVGPWLAFAFFGIPGAVAYRAVNTLDSMIGYRGAYEYLGKISARLDDIVNLIPARLSALILLISGGLSGLSVARGRRIMLRDHHITTSPNAGWTMGAMAGLLKIRLEKPDHYCLGGDLNQPTARDIGRAVIIAEQAAGLALLTTLGSLAVRLGITG